jgi:hypothetical protein
MGICPSWRLFRQRFPAQGYSVVLRRTEGVGQTTTHESRFVACFTAQGTAHGSQRRIWQSHPPEVEVRITGSQEARKKDPGIKC